MTVYQYAFYGSFVWSITPTAKSCYSIAHSISVGHWSVMKSCESMLIYC